MEKSFGVDGDIIYQKKPKANINLHYGSSTVCIFNLIIVVQSCLFCTIPWIPV